MTALEDLVRQLRAGELAGDAAAIASASAGLLTLDDDAAVGFGSWDENLTPRQTLAGMMGYASGALIKLGPAHHDAAVALAARCRELDPGSELALSLPLALGLRASQTNRRADLDRAARSLDGLPADEQALMSMVLAAMRSPLADDVDELEAGIEQGRRVLAGLRRRDPMRRNVAAGLSDALFNHFLRTQDEASFTEAMRMAGLAVRSRDRGLQAHATVRLGELHLVSPNGPGRRGLQFIARQGERLSRDQPALRLRALNLLGHAHLRSGDPGAAAGAFREAARLPQAEPAQRVAAAQLWALAADGTESLEAYRTAIGLLPVVTSRRSDREDQEYALSTFLGLGRDAAAAALEAGDPESALVLLEQGRGLMLDQVMSLRTQADELEPELAERLENALAALNDPAAEDRSARVAELDEVVVEVRALAGFGRWGLPPLFEDLRAAGAEGPVVVVNVAETRCDAIVLTDEGLRVQRLPRLTLNEATAWAERLPDADDETLRELLAWLWDVVTGPVLTHPELLGKGPRLWWVPTGPPARLPLHAAGDALDLVVPSTAPTVTALLRSRARPAPRRPPVTAVVVAEDVPGVSPLPGARKDVAMLVDRGARADGPATVVHYACHAISDAGAPSRSRLVLGPDHEVTVAELNRRQLPGTELAFLAACETMRTSGGLADEAVHLVAGFLAAGAAQVVATLWEVNDSVASRLTHTFYEGDPLSAALTLHAAVTAIRRNPVYAGRPVVWAAWVHTGR